MRIIKTNQQQNHTTVDMKSLELNQFILPASAIHQEIDSPKLHDLHLIGKIAVKSRVLIIEGISGSGKDTLQNYLKHNLPGLDVYDYSEGEVLQSWNQLRIKGIPRLRLHFMKLFIKYIKETLNREHNAVFILNRFHLSVYAMTVAQQPKLQKTYDEIINVLRSLPVHVFMLQLDINEIEKRSLHPERSGAWQKFQQEILKEEGFHDKLERYLCQQRLMLEAVQRQNIPYSIISCFPDVARDWISTAELNDVSSAKVLPRTTGAKISPKKRPFERTV